MDKIFESLASDEPILPGRSLKVWGRKITIPESTSSVARIGFEKLCGEPLSSADYLEITRQFDTIFVEDVPELGLDRKDAVSCLFALAVSTPFARDSRKLQNILSHRRGGSLRLSMVRRSRHDRSPSASSC